MSDSELMEAAEELAAFFANKAVDVSKLMLIIAAKIHDKRKKS